MQVTLQILTKRPLTLAVAGECDKTKKVKNIVKQEGKKNSETGGASCWLSQHEAVSAKRSFFDNLRQWNTKSLPKSFICNVAQSKIS